MLSVKNLKVTFGQIQAIRDVSFEVPEGKIVTLIGANGAGKTTTLRAVSGLEKAAAGSVTFKGKDITNMEAHLLVPMGISHVPEGRKIFPTLTVRGEPGHRGLGRSRTRRSSRTASRRCSSCSRASRSA